MSTEQANPTNGVTHPNGDYHFLPKWVHNLGKSLGSFGVRFPQMEGDTPGQTLMSFRNGSKPVPETETTQAAPGEANTSKTRKAPMPVQPSSGKSPKFGGGLLPKEVAVPDSSMGTTGEGTEVGPPQAEGSDLISDDAQEDFELETLRFRALKLVEYQQDLGGRPAYSCEKLVDAFVKPKKKGYSMMMADDLARRLSVNNEKPIEAVVYFNDSEGRESTFATQLTLALLKHYGEDREIELHALALSPLSDREEFQLAKKWTGSFNPLAGKRVALAVGPLTKDTWNHVARQVFYLRGIAASIKVVTVAKIGRLPAQGRAGIQIEAFTSYG